MRDDIPERIEIWEPRKKKVNRDANLDTAVRAAFGQAMGRVPAAAPSAVAAFPAFDDDEEDDIEALLMVL